MMKVREIGLRFGLQIQVMHLFIDLILTVVRNTNNLLRKMMGVW